MKCGLYHVNVGLPNISTNFGILTLQYSHHAKLESHNDRYGKINLPSHLDTAIEDVIEVEVYKNTVKKVVYRIPLDLKRDLILVINPEPNKIGFVKTVWINEVNDNHKTLNRSKYTKP